MDDGIPGELGDVEIRVLGSLMEKAKTTPDAYPLTLNSLITACNQKSSRDPVTDLDEDEVIGALDSLRGKGLAMRVDVAGSRTAKFRENATARWSLSSQEYALLTLLFLRGPQTPGQLRGRSDRLFEFAEIPQVLDRLKQMQDREEEPLSLVQSMERLPGTKEIRYVHTLAPLPEGVGVAKDSWAAERQEPYGTVTPQASPSGNESPALEERLEKLEARVADLEKLIDELTS